MSANSGHLPPPPTGLTFTAYGIVAGQGSKRHVGHGIMVESSKRVKPWRQDVKAAAEAAIEAWEQRQPLAAGTWHPIAGPVDISVTFFWPRPKSHYRAGRNADLLRDNAPACPTSRNLGDIDKILRATFDAMTSAGVWVDDALVVTVMASKAWCDPGQRPGATVSVLEVTAC